MLEGLGIGLLPELMVKDEIKLKKLKVLYPDIRLSFPVLLAHHGSYPLTLEALRMIEVLKAIVLSRYS